MAMRRSGTAQSDRYVPVAFTVACKRSIELETLHHSPLRAARHLKPRPSIANGADASLLGESIARLAGPA
jgi:hypothetical protein